MFESRKLYLMDDKVSFVYWVLTAEWRFSQSIKVGALHSYSLLKLCHLVVPFACDIRHFLLCIFCIVNLIAF